MRSLAPLAIVAALCGPLAATAQDIPDFYMALARQPLAANDGWASAGNGTTGGSQAGADRVFVATTRAELRAALSGTTPKIVFVKGTIDMNVDDANRPLTCEDYAAGTGYTLEAYLAAYDPAVWGRTTRPSGPLEIARAAARTNQQRRVQFSVPSNTSLIGLGTDARIVGGHVRVNAATNVIIRNLTLEDAYDCFPQWDPTDGTLGNWNSSYDNLSVTGSSTAGSTNVWIDHCEFTDGAHPDWAQPSYFGRPFVVHDGMLDITNLSDLVTVSWNRFRPHDKLMLIGSSDSTIGDRGKLRVTVHHNVFEGSGQRAPRVRFGQVHVFNNYYVVDAATHSYSWGVGRESAIHAQNNYFATVGSVPVSRLISVFGGTQIYEEGTMVDGRARANHVSVLDAYNAARDPDLSGAPVWQPMYVLEMHPTQAVAGLVRNNAGIIEP